jgi:hypothetical protein
MLHANLHVHHLKSNRRAGDPRFGGRALEGNEEWRTIAGDSRRWRAITRSARQIVNEKRRIRTSLNSEFHRGKIQHTDITTLSPGAGPSRRTLESDSLVGQAN